METAAAQRVAAVLEETFKHKDGTWYIRLKKTPNKRWHLYLIDAEVELIRITQDFSLDQYFCDCDHDPNQPTHKLLAKIVTLKEWLSDTITLSTYRLPVKVRVACRANDIEKLIAVEKIAELSISAYIDLAEEVGFQVHNVRLEAILRPVALNYIVAASTRVETGSWFYL